MGGNGTLPLINIDTDMAVERISRLTAQQRATASNV